MVQGLYPKLYFISILNLLKKVKEIQPVGRILSKKQRKRLEKIVDIKKKKVKSFFLSGHE